MFTPIHTFAGGLLLHISTASLLDNTGRVFGGSSILYEAIYGDHAFWRWALLGGMLVAPKLNAAIQPLAALLRVHLPTGIAEPVPEVDWPLAKLIIAGSLVGFGSKVSNQRSITPYLILISVASTARIRMHKRTFPLRRLPSVAPVPRRNHELLLHRRRHRLCLRIHNRP